MLKAVKMQQTPSEERMIALERRVAELERIVSGNQVTKARSGSSTRKQLSIKEFINDKKPQSARVVTLAIAYFLEYHEGMSPFGVRDLEQGFRSAKIPPPRNINDMVNKNIAAGLLMEAKKKKDGRKTWELTATGERIVEAGFKKR